MLNLKLIPRDTLLATKHIFNNRVITDIPESRPSKLHIKADKTTTNNSNVVTTTASSHLTKGPYRIYLR